MPEGSRVLVMSSGAAIVGAPLSGSYPGAKWMAWLMARYANGIAEARWLGVRFQVLVPMKLMADTPLGHTVANEYARRRGISIEEHVRSRYGAPMTARECGEKIAAWLAEAPAKGLAFGVGDGPVFPIDDPTFAPPRSS